MTDFERLDEALAHIEANPREWDQAHYRCETGMCLAGHVAILAAGKWAGPVNNREIANLLIAEPDDDPEYVWDCDRVGATVISVHDRARRLLDLTGDEADELFCAVNTLGDLHQIADSLRVKARLGRSAQGGAR